MKSPVELLAFFVPTAVLVVFVVHWMSLRPVQNSADRLERSRGTYLGLSAVLLLLAWTLVLLATARPVGLILLALGMSASFVGDFFNLQFPGARARLKEPLAFGIASFMVAQVFYMAAILSLLPLQVLKAEGFLIPIFIALVLIPAFIFRFRVYSPQRPRVLMVLAFVYGFLLGGMAALSLAAALARAGAWIFLACGATSFMLSDALFGDTTIRGLHPKTEFQLPWFTYLLAQGLIIAGLFLVTQGA